MLAVEHLRHLAMSAKPFLGKNGVRQEANARQLTATQLRDEPRPEFRLTAAETAVCR
jgi:hypothetical protein